MVIEVGIETFNGNDEGRVWCRCEGNGKGLFWSFSNLKYRIDGGDQMKRT